MSETVVGCMASELVPFLRVALSWSKAFMKLALVNRSRPSKALWCLTFAVLTFTALGANDGNLGIVAKTAVRDPSLIQVYSFHLHLLCCVLTYVLFPASMSVLLLMFCLSIPELSMLFSLAFSSKGLLSSYRGSPSRNWIQRLLERWVLDDKT
ncbi:hypothetical protein GQ457_06G043550 [Hibiscus cannabinus]